MQLNFDDVAVWHSDIHHHVTIPIHGVLEAIFDPHHFGTLLNELYGLRDLIVPVELDGTSCEVSDARVLATVVGRHLLLRARTPFELVRDDRTAAKLIGY